MDWSDTEVSDTWFAEEGATVTCSGGGATATGPLAGAGAELNMGTAFNFSGSIICYSFLASLTSYGKISAITCFGQSLSMGSVVLYNPGTGAAPSAAYPDWKRAAPVSGAYLLLKDDGGVALQRSASVGYSVGTSYTGGFAATAPITLNYKGTYARRFEP
jgi:hypothetical protein